MICKNCGKENIEGAKFCFACGSKLEGVSVAVAQATQQFTPVVDKVICSSCHNANKAGLKFCCYCGSDLTGKATVGLLQEETNCDVTIPQSAKKKSKSSLVVVLVVLIAILGAGAVALLAFNPFGSDESETSDTNNITINQNIGVSYQEQTKGTSVEVTESVQNPGITDLTGIMNRGQNQDLLGRIGTKEDITGLSIKILIASEITQSAELYANEQCAQQCGEDGIFAVIDAKNNILAVATVGKGEKYLSSATNRLVKEGAAEYLKKGQYYEACVELLDSILDSERVSRFEAVEGAEQVIYVEKNSGSNTGKLTLVEWVDGYEEVLYEANKVYLGKDGITDSPSESKCATPKGTFKLGFAFSDRKLSTKLDSKVIKSGDVWVDDSDSEYYNTLQHGSASNSKWSSAENTYYAFSSGLFEACILIEHNGDGYTKGVSGKGSCIYLSGKNKELSTSYGDVNITAEQMETILSYLDEAKNPHIVIR